jgi:threonine-phosphate decarboxylase
VTAKPEHGGRILSIAQQLRLQPEELIDFSASINPFGPPEAVLDAVTAALGRVGHYPDSDAGVLVDGIAALHGCRADNVCVGNGSTELIYLVPRIFPGKRALLVGPTFAEYGHALSLAGWQTEYLHLKPEEGFALEAHLVRRQLARGCDLLFLCNPGNPTGRLYPPHEVAELLSHARSAGTPVVVDEAFMDFCEEASVKEMVLSHGGALILRSMTKFYSFPGLRLGYALAEPSLTARLSAQRPPWSVNSLAQAAGIAALKDREFSRRSRELIAAERDFLGSRLAALPGLKVYPGAANYLLLELPDGLTAARLQEHLLRECLLIRDCAGFPGLTPRFLRVAVRTRRENERLLAALAGLLP